MIKVAGDPFGAVRHAVACLRAGKVIAVPTDTVYGLAASAQNQNAIDRLYEIKARDKDNPLAICLAEVSEVGKWADVVHLPERLLEELLPGPVTIVLKRKNELNKFLNPGTVKIGIRIPNHNFIRGVVKNFGGPIALTSANVSSHPSSLTTEEFQRLWPMLDAVFDEGKLAGSRKASTVVDLSFPRFYRILRDGSARNETVAVLERFRLQSLDNT